jgi:tetratricopeptide (TPR) repeat protein
MSDQPFTFTLRLEDFDLSRLPIAADTLRASPDLLAEAISQYYSGIFLKLGGTANVAVTEGAVHVSWYPKTGAPRDLIFERALALLQKGNYREADPLLQSLHARFPDDEEVLFNYGMMLSDQGRLDLASSLLAHLVELTPDHSHGWTALGVARSRRRDAQGALEAFQTALRLDPANAYAMRNAGALLIEADPAAALPLFEKAAALLPDDQQTLLGYGRCLVCLSRELEGDRILRKCIGLNHLTDQAEQARTALRELAHKIMRSNVGGGVRPDVVMYCLGAMERFRALGPEKTKAVTFEIAMLGRSGFDINDPAQKYSLKSLPGKFSGLHLVSIMYTGMKAIAPGPDEGIDLSREYTEARKLFDAGRTTPTD